MAKMPFNARPQPPRQRQQSTVRHYLKEWRKRRGLSQEQLAGRVEVSRGLIAQYETGRTHIPEDMIYALAEALDCNPGDLFDVNPLKEGEVVDITDELRELPEAKRLQVLGYVRGLKAG